MAIADDDDAVLAYVFWHRPDAADSRGYEHDLARFHASLTSEPPAGFIRLATSGVRGAPWLPQGAESYEDWYVVRGWSALGRLNHAAVAATHVDSHDRIARQSTSGTGAVYGLQGGDGSLGAVTTWFAKPRDWRYDQVDRAVAAAQAEGFSLWRRQLVLGPAPEFCLQGSTAPQLAAPLQSLSIVGRPVN